MKEQLYEEKKREMQRIQDDIEARKISSKVSKSEVIPPSLPQKTPPKYLGDDPATLPPVPPVPVSPKREIEIERPDPTEIRRRKRMPIYYESSDSDDDSSMSDYYRFLTRNRKTNKLLRKDRPARQYADKEPFDLAYQQQVQRAKRDMMMQAVFGPST